jgi:hypothetical protein
MDEPVNTQSRGGGISEVLGQLKAERNRFILMRASFLLVAVMVAAFLAWALPAVPFGASAGDYTPASATSVLLCAIAWFASLVFLMVWAPYFRRESLPEFVRVLFGAQQLIRGRQQFQSRLSAECRKAKRDRRHVFSVIVVQVATARNGAVAPDAAKETELASLAIRGGVRGDDIVAAAEPNEVWVLALAAPAEGRERVVERLARALLELHASTGSTHTYRIGAGTIGLDGESPDDLFGAARQRITSLAELVDAVPKAA